MKRFPKLMAATCVSLLDRTFPKPYLKLVVLSIHDQMVSTRSNEQYQNKWVVLE